MAFKGTALRKVSAAVRDPRLTPARPDLAAAWLQGEVEAERYVEGETRILLGPFAALTRIPDATAPLDSMILHGESFEVYEDKNGWVWGRSGVDGYVGYAPAAGFLPAAESPEPTHKVIAPTTHLYPEPKVRSYPAGALSRLSRVALTGAEEKGFAEIEGGLWIPSVHLAGLEDWEPDYILSAMGFLGVPYLWGGRSSGGIDCSGLIQMALAMAGIEAPRDSDMQEADVGRTLIPGEKLRRGDLVFWPGHVGLLTSPRGLVHANAHHMAVAAEPLRDAVERIGAPRCYRRLPLRRPAAPKSRS